MKAKMVSFFLLISWPLLTEDLNIAVAGAGGVNSYVSFLVAQAFVKHSGYALHKLFDQFWGTSGGTLTATWFMSPHLDNEDPLKIFREFTHDAMPGWFSFIQDPFDDKGKRRENFHKILAKYFSDLRFGSRQNNKFVYVASSYDLGQPIFFCDPDIGLNHHVLRCTEGTSCIDGIIGSSCFISSLSLPMLPKKQFYLFQPNFAYLLPLPEEKLVVDACHLSSSVNNLDGVTPTPLVIKYLQEIPGHHNVVVFDNGGPQDMSFRKSLNVDGNGMATIIVGLSIVNLFIITIPIKNFAMTTGNTSSLHLNSLEKQTKEALLGNSSMVFLSALSAILASRGL